MPGASIGDVYQAIHVALEYLGYIVDGQKDGLVVSTAKEPRTYFVVSVLDITAAMEARRA